MVFPWIPFLKQKAGGKLSDIEFLSIKEFDGKLVQNDGSKTTTGDLATLTASSGKDMYVAKAKIVATLSSNPGAGYYNTTVALKINGVTEETVVLSFARTSTSGDGQSNTLSYEFVNIGRKVAATEIIKLEVTTINSLSVNGVLLCFEETTGETPQVASI